MSLWFCVLNALAYKLSQGLILLLTIFNENVLNVSITPSALKALTVNVNCLSNVVSKAKAGSIIVFHDSEKAFSSLQYALPQVLKEFSEKEYGFKQL